MSYRLYGPTNTPDDVELEDEDELEDDEIDPDDYDEDSD